MRSLCRLGLFLLGPRMLLYRSRGQTTLPPAELARRVTLLGQQRWGDLLAEAAQAAAAVPSQPRHGSPARPEQQDDDRRAERAAALAHLGELSAASSALEAAPLAPATLETLATLHDLTMKTVATSSLLPRTVWLRRTCLGAHGGAAQAWRGHSRPGDGRRLPPLGVTRWLSSSPRPCRRHAPRTCMREHSVQPPTRASLHAQPWCPSSLWSAFFTVAIASTCFTMRRALFIPSCSRKAASRGTRSCPACSPWASIRRCGPHTPPLNQEKTCLHSWRTHTFPAPRQNAPPHIQGLACGFGLTRQH